jgi:hypothetical protein
VLLLVLRTNANEDELQSILPSLEVTLSAHATDAVPQGSGNAASASGKHDLTSSIISGQDSSKMSTAGTQTFVCWRQTLHLTRPRVRLQRPAVYFTAYLNISKSALNLQKQKDNELLTSYEPLPTNILEALNFDPSMSNSSIQLSESHFTKVAPLPSDSYGNVKPIRGASKRAFPIIPALFTRIRYSALPDSVVASLHLESSRLMNRSVAFEDITLDVPDATVECLVDKTHLENMHAGDERVSLYKLTPKPKAEPVKSAKVFVAILATLQRKGHDNIALDIKWQAQVDLSQKAAAPLYKWSRPLSSGAQHGQRPSVHEITRKSLSDVQIQSTTSQTDEAGMVFNFSAAPSVKMKETFRLKVKCVNRSSRTRRFALLSVRPRKKGSVDLTTRYDPSKDDADLVAKVFNAPPLEIERPPDVEDLNSDVRVGPLQPETISEAEMEFRAVAAGPLDLGIVRILDLDTRRTVDVLELPDVVALEFDDQPIPVTDQKDKAERTVAPNNEAQE